MLLVGIMDEMELEQFHLIHYTNQPFHDMLPHKQKKTTIPISENAQT
jgi:hypothetical protein